MVAGCLALSLMGTAIQTYLPDLAIEAYASQAGVISSGVDNVYFRSSPGGTPLTHNGNAIFLSAGQQLTILDTSNTTWYQIKLTYDGTEYTGYVASQFITIGSNESSNSAEETNNTETNNTETNNTDTNNSSITYGDVNSDGKINALDVLKIQKHTIGAALLTGDSLVAADVNQDGKINALDVLKVQKYIVGAGTIEANNNSGNSTGDNGNGGNNTSETDFETYLSNQGFPESYKPYLRELHNQYPEWKFVAVKTGLDWSYVVENEVNKQGSIKNSVETSSSSPNYNWRSSSVYYDWSKDEWYPCDGTRWFAASDDFTTYYLDPRVYLYESYIFGFESLSYQNNIHNINGIESILSGTFMYNTVPKGETKKYSELILDAAKTTKVSPYYLASKIKNELGTTISI